MCVGEVCVCGGEEEERSMCVWGGEGVCGCVWGECVGVCGKEEGSVCVRRREVCVFKEMYRCSK